MTKEEKQGTTRDGVRGYMGFGDALFRELHALGRTDLQRNDASMLVGALHDEGYIHGTDDGGDELFVSWLPGKHDEFVAMVRESLDESSEDEE